MGIVNNKYFFNAFASSGDRTAVPDNVQVDGSVSYAQGWGPDYEAQLGVNPNALPIPRTQDNQLYNDITLALKQYQEWGTPNYITITQNEGTPFPYDKYAFALYDDGINGPRVFQSLININTNKPSESPIAQTFTAAGNILTIADSTPYYTGSSVTLSTTGALPSPLVAGTLYYVINLSPTTISLASSLSNAINNIPITLTTAGSGTNTITIPVTWIWVESTTNSDAVIYPSASFETGVVDGNVVYWNAGLGVFSKAISNGAQQQNAIGIADVTNARVYISGYVPILSGLTAGSLYYLSTTTAGQLSSQPLGSNVVMGCAISTTNLILNIAVNPYAQVGFTNYKSRKDIVSNNGTNPNTDLDFAAATVRDSTDICFIKLTSTLTKRITTAWSAGNNGGATPAGLLPIQPGTTYHEFYIMKPDGTVDCGVDTDISATNLLAAASGYTIFQRVGSKCITDSLSHIIPSVQFNNMILWVTPTIDFNYTFIDLLAHLAPIVTPAGLQTQAILMTQCYSPGDNTGMFYVSSPSVSDQAAGFLSDPAFGNIGMSVGAATTIDDQKDLMVITNTASQVRIRSKQTGDTINISTQGYIDYQL